MTKLIVSTAFDSGSLRVKEATEDGVRALIVADAEEYGGPFMQWFHFRVMNLKPGKKYAFSLDNAGECTYAVAFEGYKVCYSHDRTEWLREVSTSYDGKALTWSFSSAKETTVYFAYYPPYSRERQLDFLGEVERSPLCVEVGCAGLSCDGDTIDVVKVRGLAAAASAASPKELVVIARQHPGETQASWWIEGFVRRLLDEEDPVSRALLRAGARFTM